MKKIDNLHFNLQENTGGAAETRTPYLFNAIEALGKYLEFLEIKALSDSYIL